MEEVRRVGFADSRDEERIVGVNGPAKAQGRVDPREGVSYAVNVAATRFF